MYIFSNLFSLCFPDCVKGIYTQKRNQIGFPIALVLCIAAITLSSCVNPQPSKEEVSPSSDQTEQTPSDVLKFKFGVYTSDKPTTVVQQFRPILNVLETQMSKNIGKSVDIEIKVYNTYEKGIESLVKGEVDFSRLGPVSYIEAKLANSELSILAVENEAGTKVFYGIICVAQDSPIQNVRDIQGKSFAFGNELSTIGRFLSQQYLVENGIKAKDLGGYEYLGRHDKVGAAVGLGEFDAGALKESSFNKLLKNGTPIRELARFPNATKPWVASSDLPEEIQTQLRQALLAMDDPTALEALGKDGFLEGSDEDYQIIREAIENNDAFFE